MGKSKKMLTLSIVALLLAVQCTLALAYSPDVIWQSHGWFTASLEAITSWHIDSEAIDEILRPSDFALMGYRIFLAANALIFGLDSRAEIIGYTCLVFIVCLSLVDIFWKDAKKEAGEIKKTVASLAICAPLIGFQSTVPRGMEIGQYAGAAVFISAVWLYLRDGNKKDPPARGNAPHCVAIFLSIVLLSGGYAVGSLLGLVTMRFFIHLKGSYWPTKLTTGINRFICCAAAGIASHYIYRSALLAQKDGGAPVSFQSVNPLDILKWLIASLGSAFFNANSFEGKITVAYPWAIVASLTILAISIIAAIAKSKNGLDYRPSTIYGIFLATQGLGVATGLYFARAYSHFQILSPWYSYFFKIAVSGLLLVAFSGTFSSSPKNWKIDRLRWASFIVLCSLVFVLTGISSYFQVRRYPHEREFWNERQAYILSTGLRVTPRNTDTSGVSPLALDEKTDSRLVRLLKNQSLGPFNTSSPVDVLASLAETLWLGERRDFPIGVFDDGMMGPLAVIKGSNLRAKGLICLRVPESLPNNAVRLQGRSNVITINLKKGQRPTCVSKERLVGVNDSIDEQRIVLVAETASKPRRSTDKRNLSAQLTFE